MRSTRFALCLLIASTFISCSSSEEAQVDPIRIGGLWSQTGPGAELDVPSMNGAKLALKEINVNGIMGRKLEMVTFDAQRDSAVAANAVLTADNNIVCFIGLSDADPALGAGKAATVRNLPFITSGATYPKLPQIAGGSTFLACFGDNVQAAAAAEFAFDTLKRRNAFVLYDLSTTYTTALKDYFMEAWEQRGGSLSGVAGFGIGATNLMQQIADLNTSDADVVFFSGVPDDIVNVIRSIRSAGIKLPIIGGDGLDASSITDSLTASESSDVYFTTHTLVSTSTSAAMASFITSYEAEYGVAPTSAFAALGYDAMKLMAHAIEEAGTTKPESLFDAIEAIHDFPGLTGHISYAAGNHVPRKSVTVIRVLNREYSRAAEFVPGWIPPP